MYDSRKQTDAKIALAHEKALEEWPDAYLDRTSAPVRGNPWIRPLRPKAEDRAFIAARREIQKRLEVRPTGHHSVTRDGPRVVSGWEAVEAD